MANFAFVSNSSIVRDGIYVFSKSTRVGVYHSFVLKFFSKSTRVGVYHRLVEIFSKSTRVDVYHRLVEIFSKFTRNGVYHRLVEIFSKSTRVDVYHRLVEIFSKSTRVGGNVSRVNTSLIICFHDSWWFLKEPLVVFFRLTFFRKHTVC